MTGRFLLALSLSLLFLPLEGQAQTIDIGPNQYAFRFTGNTNYGLFFNAAQGRYEFRNGSAAPIFGFNADNGQMSTNLEFGSSADYLVPNNRYAFRAKSNPNYGLYFNAASLQYEFRDGSANPAVTMSANSGNMAIQGGLRVGNTSDAEAGTIRWNGSELQGHDGSEWKSLTAEGIPGPEGPEGPEGPAGPAGTYTTGVGLSLSGNELSAQNEEALWHANRILGKPIFQPANLSNGAILRYSEFFDDWFPSTVQLGSNWNLSANEDLYTFKKVALGHSDYQLNTSLDLNGTLFVRTGSSSSNAGSLRMGHPHTGNQWQLNTTSNGANLLLSSKPQGSSTFSNRVVFAQSGNVGIGVSTPTAPLHVSAGNWDLNNTDGDLMIGNASHKLKMSVSTAGGGAGIARINSMGTSPSLQLGAGGYSALNITGDAGTGIGTAWAAVEMKFGSSRSLVFELVPGGDPAIRPDASGWGVLGTENHRFWRAYVNTYYGLNTSIQSVSDASLKENVAPMEKGLEKLMKLNPVHYDFIPEKLIEEAEGRERLMDQDIKDQMGFIAQEVQEIFPQLVRPLSDDSDILTLGYSGLIPVIVQSIQEQQGKINELSPEGMVSRQEFDELKAENELLKSRLDRVLERLDSFDHELESCCFGEHDSKAAQSSPGYDGPELGQNIPNPFRESTVIQYYLPENTNGAIIRIIGLDGKPVRDLQLPAAQGRNQVEVHTSGMAAGTYLYSLFVDGELIATKKMMIAR